MKQTEKEIDEQAAYAKKQVVATLKGEQRHKMLDQLECVRIKRQTQRLLDMPDGASVLDVMRESYDFIKAELLSVRRQAEKAGKICQCDSFQIDDGHVENCPLGMPRI